MRYMMIYDDIHHNHHMYDKVYCLSSARVQALLSALARPRSPKTLSTQLPQASSVMPMGIGSRPSTAPSSCMQPTTSFASKATHRRLLRKVAQLKAA